MDYRRARQPGGTYFFTVVTHARQPLLIDHVDRLRRAFRTVRARAPFDLEAIVILPDHLHAVWRLPQGDADFSSRWQRIKRLFSSGIDLASGDGSRQRKRERAVWQRRFWEHAIRDGEDWRRHVDYIHFNPVKHGVAPSPGQWPHSSFRRAVQQGWYAADWGSQVVPAGLQGMHFE
ncbi:MAG TPA: transposase [Gammaproteobacteria bacterium]